MRPFEPTKSTRPGSRWSTLRRSLLALSCGLAAAMALVAPAARAALTPEPPGAPTPPVECGAGQARTGCSTLDLIQRPDLLLDPLAQGIIDAVLDVEAGMYREGVLIRGREARDLAGFRQRLLRALVAAEDAGEALPNGDVCGSSRSLSRAESVFRGLLRRVAKRIASVERPRKTALERTFGDAGDREMRFRKLHYLERVFEEVLGRTTQAEASLDAACRGHRKETIKGEIVKVDDLRRRVRLADGTVLGLKESGYSKGIYPNGDVTGVAKVFPDGSALFDDVVVDPVQTADVDPGACIALRFAPIQPWWPEFPYGAALGTNGRGGLDIPDPATDPYVLHHPEAYRPNPSVDLHVVEQDMRVAAVRQYCLTDGFDTPTHFHRYSMDIALQIRGDTRYVAWSLEPGDAPVAFSPFDLTDSGIGTLEVKVKQQVCSLRIDLDPGVEPDVTWNDIGACADPNADSCPIQRDWDDFDDYVEPYDCSVPVVYRTETYEVDFVPRGSMCSATYESSVFDLEDDALDEHRNGKVTSVSAPELGNVEFFADGYTPADPTPIAGGKYMASLMTVSAGESFGVFAWEPCTAQAPNGHSAPTTGCTFPEDKQTALRRTATSKPSALRWPRVVGERGGNQFAYTCSLPTVVRDVIDFCSNEPHTFYRFPFDPSEGAIEMGQANCACGAGEDCTHCCDCNQKYAFDVPVPEYTLVRAARGGKVIDVRSTTTDNCWDEECPQGYWGNYVTIRHQDGTTASYLHMPVNGPAVAVGDRVRRGDEIGVSGNTGNSSGPHLHFQEDVSGMTNLMRFELELVQRRPKQPPAFEPKTCFTPVRGNEIHSTNHAPQ